MFNVHNKKSTFLEIGSVLNGYRVVDYLDKGGFSQVYIVESMRFNSLFAAKIINIPNKSNKMREAFNNEVEALMKLDHPNIIRLYEYFEYFSYYVLILEYCSGGSLADEIDMGGPISINRLKQISRYILSALCYSHSQNIAHHDIKPKNILFDSFGRPKLADFGICICSEYDEECSNFHCSLAFAPPEIVQKKTFNPFLADIWSLGITLAYAVNGFFPLSDRNEEALSMSIIHGMFIFSKNLSEQEIYFIKKLLKIDPEQRPSALSLLKDPFLEQFELITIRTKNPSMIRNRTLKIIVSQRRNSHHSWKSHPYSIFDDIHKL